jgi:hypothetical protein
MKKYTTVALDDCDYLICDTTDYLHIEAYMLGYTNGKRNKNLDGWYFISELKKILP